MGIICLYVLIQKSGQKTAKSHICAVGWIFHYIFFIIHFRCSQETCDECLETFEGYKFIPSYDCDAECKNCEICDSNPDYFDTVSVCKYCVEGESNCASLCKTGKTTCLSCELACKNKRKR